MYINKTTPNKTVCKKLQTNLLVLSTRIDSMKKNPTQTKEKELCPICKNGMKCESIVFHSKHWNTEGGN